MIEFNPLSFAEELEKLAGADERKGFWAGVFDNSQRKHIDRRGERQYSREVTEDFRKAKNSGYKHDIHTWFDEVGEENFKEVRDYKSEKAVLKQQQKLHDAANPSIWREHGSKILGAAALAGAGMYALNKLKQPSTNLVVNMPAPPQAAPAYVEPVGQGGLESAPEQPKKSKK